MFYETTHTVRPGWHRSYKPSHYEEMSWSPPRRNLRSLGSSPETYRRVLRTEEDFPGSKDRTLDDEFFAGRRSPTFPRIFREAWRESPSANHRFADRPRMFKRVFKPNHWEEEFDKEDIPRLRRFEREFDRFDNNRPSSRKFDEDFDSNRPSSRKFDEEFDSNRPSSRKFDEEFDSSRPSSRKFDEDFDRHFNARDQQRDEFGKPEGRVHHIPIMVEHRMEGMKGRFGERDSPPPERSHDEEYGDDWTGPQVHRLKKTFEPEEGFQKEYHRVPRFNSDMRSRVFSGAVPETWDLHAIRTLPTRKLHKASQSMDDSKHSVPSKSVFRSYSETHEDVPKPHQQQHSAAFRSHSDGHCPNQTYVTKIQVNAPSSKKDRTESQSEPKQQNFAKKPSCEETPTDQNNVKSRSKAKYDSPSLQQIAVVMQNVDDLIVRIEGYSGNGRDKQYRFLDEMLTRCMIRLDGIDTEGREDIRNARKAAIRDVQACIDRLEAKADESERQQTAKSVPEDGGSVATGDVSKTAIPLGCPFAIPLSASKDPIPLGDVPKSAAIPLGDGPQMAIPLGDVPIPLADKSAAPIPLGYVPRSTDDKNSSQCSGNNNDEQTKL